MAGRIRKERGASQFLLDRERKNGYIVGVMSIFRFVLMSAVLMGGIAPVAYCAEDDAPSTQHAGGKKKKKAAKEEELSPVAESLQNVVFMTGKPMKGAKYYVYFVASPRSGPCKTLVPQVLREYKKMKAKKVELIFIVGLVDEDEARKYVKEYKVKAPTLHYENSTVAALLGYNEVCETGVPHTVIVDAEGKVLGYGHDAEALDWKKLCKPNKK